MESVAFIQWCLEHLELLDNHFINDYRKLLHPFPIGSDHPAGIQSSCQ